MKKNIAMVLVALFLLAGCGQLTVQQKAAALQLGVKTSVKAVFNKFQKKAPQSVMLAAKALDANINTVILPYLNTPGQVFPTGTELTTLLSSKLTANLPKEYVDDAETAVSIIDLAIAGEPASNVLTTNQLAYAIAGFTGLDQACQAVINGTPATGMFAEKMPETASYFKKQDKVKLSDNTETTSVKWAKTTTTQ